MYFNNGRIESKNGIRFYEKDILLSDNIFSGDIVLKLNIDYYTAGFGILLNEFDEREPDKNNNMFLFKIGFRDFTVISKNYDTQKELLRMSNIISAPRERLELTFSKIGNKIEMKSGDILLGSYILKNSIDKYKIGIYSNLRNCVRNISYYAGAPNGWVVNIENTNGGSVKFYRDGFEIKDCEKDAEIEQSKIELKKGIYNFGCDISGDIKPYIFLWNDDRFDDEAKNILHNNKIELLEDNFVNIKFKGLNGSVENICIKNSEKEKYVSTDNLPIITNGSEMIIKLKGLKSVLLEGTINSVPLNDTITDEKKYSIILSSGTRLFIEDFPLYLNQKYSYEYIVSNGLLIIENMDTDEEVCRKIINTEDGEEFIKAFKNIGAIVDRIFITKDNGEQIEVLLQKTNKVYVPFEIKGPILVLDKDYIPLDLSASYRENVNGEYIFTNWEREIFESANILYYENKMINISGNIKIYGIPNDAITQEDNILKIDKADSIDLYSNKYDIIKESEFSIDYFNNIIKLKNGIAEKYKQIVVDYLKDDSYCINYIDSLKSYEIDTSTSKEKIFVMYDFKNDSQKYGNVSEYKVTDIMPDTNKYIVLRKDGY